MDREMNLLGPIFREARLKLEPPLSLCALARKLTENGTPMSRYQIAAIEKQTRKLRDYEMVALMDVLNIPPQVLYELVASKFAPQEENAD